MEKLAELVMLQLEKGGRARLTVTGWSMMPMLRNCRDIVELIPISGRQKSGDIIFYRRENGQYVLHRIIAVTEDGYVCCGDNQAERENVLHTQLLAVVDGFIRNGKQHTMDETGYRLYTAAWVKLFPVRRYYIALRRCLGGIRYKLEK